MIGTSIEELQIEVGKLLNYLMFETTMDYEVLEELIDTAVEADRAELLILYEQLCNMV